MEGHNRLNIIILYYSRNGITGLLANSIMEEVGGDLFNVKLVDKMKEDSAKIYAWQDELIMVTTTEVKDEEKIELDDYDLVFIGSPIWAADITPQIDALINNVDFSGKKIAFFYVHEGLKGSVENKIKEKLATSEVLDMKEFIFSDSLDKKLLALKAREWSRKIVEQLY